MYHRTIMSSLIMQSADLKSFTVEKIAVDRYRCTVTVLHVGRLSALVQNESSVFFVYFGSNFHLHLLQALRVAAPKYDTINTT